MINGMISAMEMSRLWQGPMFQCSKQMTSVKHVNGRVEQILRLGYSRLVGLSVGSVPVSNFRTLDGAGFRKWATVLSLLQRY